MRKLTVGSKEFINNLKRWCLWLKDAKPSELRKYPEIVKRLDGVRRFRLESSRKVTNDLAQNPSQFAYVSHKEKEYVIIPSVSSERRRYIPMGFMPPNVIASNLCLIIPNATLYHFGVLMSQMHMAWVKAVCGRLKSDYRYSNNIVYNNYPWPKKPSDKQMATVESASQQVLDTRLKYPDSSLADLYDPLTMPPDLVKAHNVLDKAVDKCYRGVAFHSEAERLEYLFMLYNKYTEPLIVTEKTKKRRRAKRV